jgi:very-short-patch-repair endonuclease
MPRVAGPRSRNWREETRAAHDLAGRQHGVLARWQLAAAGVSEAWLRREMHHGRLVLVHRGVYQVGPVVAAWGREMAAVLAGGPDALLSHASAAGLWSICPRPDPGDPVDITVVGRDRGHRPGIRRHRPRRLLAGERTVHEGIPTTTPARTLVDIAADLARAGRHRELEQALARAMRDRLVTSDDIALLIARYPRRTGVRLLRALIEGDAEPVLTRSEAEELFFRLVREAGLRKPRVNCNVLGYECDFVWREERVIVEVDGFAFHSARHHFEADHRRTTRLTAAGYVVIRVTWDQLVNETLPTMVAIGQALVLRQAELR